ncbi:MAG: hypothetical protein ABEJ03_03805 [Candidatus Nanohaloarchaea archaeon]
MRRKLLLLALLLLLPGVQGLDLSGQEVRSLPERLLYLQVEDGKIATSSQSSVYVLKNNSTNRINPPGYIKGQFDFHGEEIGIGTRVTASDFYLYSDEGEMLIREGLINWVDGIERIDTDNGKGYLVGSHPYLVLINRDGSKTDISRENLKIKSPRSPSTHADSDAHREFIVRTNFEWGSAEIRSYDTNGTFEWKFEKEASFRIGHIDREKVLVAWNKKLATLNFSTGEVIDRKAAFTDTRIASGESGIYYSNSSHLIKKDFSLGTRFSRKIDTAPDNIWKHPNRGYLVATQGSNITYFSTEGRKLDSLKVGEISDVGFFSNGDTAVASGHEVIRIETGEERRINLNSSLLVGSGRDALRAISLGADIATDRNNIQEVSKLTNKTASSLSSAKLPIKNSKERWHVNSRNKAIYAAPLAEENEASITFKDSNYSRDLSRVSVSELRKMYIKKQRPNHLVLANFSSDNGVLASYMAAEEGYLPVNTEGKSVSEIRASVKRTFDRIGHNKKTVEEGRFISILDAPRIKKKDPVNGLFKDSEDGSSFKTDLQYGNLDEDRFIEAAVGRYPERYDDVLFHRSIKRDKGGNALVASEYLHYRWPVILATAGGGMRAGTAAEEILKTEDYSEVTHLIEQRADVVALLLDIVQLPSTVRNVQKTANTASQIMKDSLVNSARNFFLLIRGLEYVEHGLEVFLEYRWSENWIDSEISLPDEPTPKGLKDFTEQFLPDKHPELNSSSLSREIRTSDIIYYSGSGNGTSWNLPENGRYTREFESSEIPDTRNSVVYDMSSNGATEEAAMKSGFMDSGAASYIGFSSVSYHSYASHIGKKFLEHGKKTGLSLMKGVNSLRSTSFIFNPASSFRTGVRSKMESSAVLYGNPETPKDPLPEETTDRSLNCDRGVCTLKISYSPAEITSSKTTMQAFAPMIPIRTETFDIPEGSKMLDVDTHENFIRGSERPPKLRPLTTSGKSFSRNITYSNYPDDTLKVRKSGNELLVVQALQKIENNQTMNLERSRISVTYSSPLSIEIMKRGRNIKARIYSGSRRNLTLSYSAGENFSRKEISVSGEKTVDLVRASYGRHRVSATVYNSRIKASSERTVKIPAPFETTIDREKIKSLQVTVQDLRIENPNTFTSEQNLSIQVRGNAALSPFEEASRTVKLGPEEKGVTKWRVVGTDPGPARIKVGNTSETYEVRNPDEESWNSHEILHSSTSPSTRIKTSRSHEEAQIVVESPEGYLKIRKTPQGVKILIETQRYSYRSTRNGSCRKSSLKVSGKIFRRGCSSEFIKRRGDIEGLNGTLQKPESIAKRGTHILNEVMELRNSR